VLEDRIVKRLFAAVSTSARRRPTGRIARACTEIPLLTRGAERADDAEIQQNPRSAACDCVVQRVQSKGGS